MDMRAAVLAIMGASTQLLTTQHACTLQPDPAAVLGSARCTAWLEPPFRYKDILHANVAPEALQVTEQPRHCFHARLSRANAPCQQADAYSLSASNSCRLLGR